ncbi:MAG: hypothetical protein WBB79_06195, partial [Candidatus Macondimonas sp.]
METLDLHDALVLASKKWACISECSSLLLAWIDPRRQSDREFCSGNNLVNKNGGIIMKRLSCAALMLLAPALGHAQPALMEDQALAEVSGQALVGSPNGIFQTYTVFDQTLYVPFEIPDDADQTGPGRRPIVIGNFVCDTCLIVAGIKIGLVASYVGAEASLLA